MELEEIKRKVDDGYLVNWFNNQYHVVKDKLGRYLIHCPATNYYVGLTWTDGKTMNGDPEEFYCNDKQQT
jgi:hypothetical protein